MKTILTFLKPYKLPIIIAYTLTFIELAAELLFPFFLGLMINDGIMNENMNNVIVWGTIMIVLTAITFLSGIVNSYISSHVSAASAYDMREKLFANIQAFSFELLGKYPTSTLVTRFTNDVRQVQNTIFMSLRIMVRAPLMVIGSVMMAFIVNVKISLIFLITVPLLIWFLYWVLVKGSKMFTNVQESVDHVNRVIQENIAGMRVIKAFVRGNFENKRFKTANKTLARETEKAFRFVESSMPILLFTMNISLLFILFIGNKQIIAGSTSVGDVVAIINYALRTIMAISMFTFIALAFSRAKSSAERIEPILNETATDEHIGSKEARLHSGKIEFKNVSFSYPNGAKPVLENISFTINDGEQVAIIGATGSGKTTLFQLIPQLYLPDDGMIFIDNEPITQFKAENLRENIGYIPQSPLLFTGTIKDNIKFGKEDATDVEVIQAAKDAQIHQAIESFPNQYDTIVGQKGVNLSGGQKQRLSIARALIRKPKILLFDDSTSALDLKTEGLLLDSLKKYPCSTLIITQKITTAQKANRILLLDDGKVLAFDSHEQLLKTSKLYANIVASQLQKELPYV